MTTTRLPKTITADALLATPIPPVKWIIPSLLPAGLAIFAGPSKAGKSWLTLWLCLQISQGKSVWGREIEPRTVLYFSLEDTLGRLQERLYQLVDAEEDPGTAHFADGKSWDWAGIGRTNRQLHTYLSRY